MKLLKIVSVIILVLALIGLAYVQALFSRQKSGEAEDVWIGRQESKEEFTRTEHYKSLVDSIRQFCLDSILSEGTFVTIDSMAPALLDSSTVYTRFDSLQNEIDRLGAELGIANDKIENYEIDKKAEFEKLVYRYYSREIASLPTDLTDYERSVSIKEIKGKATKYFGVTATKLEEIVRKHK